MRSVVYWMIVIAILAAGVYWWMTEGPFFRSDPGCSNEGSAAASLRNIATMEFDFRSNDRDGNGRNDFWVKDVAGMYGMEAGGRPIRLIALDVARADKSANSGAYPSVKNMAAKAGYRFAQIPRYREGGKEISYDDGSGRNAARFGLVTYPEAYEVTGNLTFIISESGTMYKKDTGGKPVEVFPEDPLAEGWATMD